MANETPRSKTILVVGGGIAGITAAVETVEACPAIGSRVDNNWLTVG